MSPLDRVRADLDRLSGNGFCADLVAMAIGAAELLTPPEKISTTDCAARFRYIPDPEGAGASLWDRTLTPYINPIQDAGDDPETNLIIVPKPGRVGGTIAAENMLFKRLLFGPRTDTLGDSFGSGLTGGFNIGSIGSRKKNFVFDPTGENRTKGAGVETYKTAEDAVKAAIRSAIERGIITGIRDSTKRLLTAGKDFDKALEKAVAFEGVFTRLKERTDPVGAAIDALDKEFNQLRRIFAEAGASTAEYSQLEQLYALERADAVKAAAKDMTSALQSFLDDLRFKGETGLSLRTREAAARAAYNPLADTIRAGGAVDQEAFTENARAYLDLSRQIYGSTAPYFARLKEVTELTVKAIQNAGGTVTAINATVQQAAAAATGLGGTTANGTGTTAAANATNDNGAIAGSIVQAIAEQTKALQIPADRAAYFTADAMSEAVRKAFAGGSLNTDASGNTTFTVKPVVDTLMEQNKILVSRFDKLIEVSENMGTIKTTAPRGGSTVAPATLKLGSLRNG